jgi:hypothetical protein
MLYITLATKYPLCAERDIGIYTIPGTTALKTPVDITLPR